MGCQKKKQQTETLNELFKTYENGMICKCAYDGKTVYSCSINANDASGVIFDAKGNKIGGCNYAYGQVDTICGELEECELVYCVEDNIWGLPYTDLYDLD